MKTTIRKYRKRQKITLRNLAAQVGKSSARLCEYEHGQNIPLLTLYKIAQVLGISTGDLFQEDDAANTEEVTAHA